MLIIFDLDDTLIHEGFEKWPAKDAHICKGTKRVLNYCRNKDYIMAIASHNYEAEKLLKKYNLHLYFKVIVGRVPQFYNKLPLIKEIMEKCNVDDTSVVYYFDDLYEMVQEMKNNHISAKHVSWEKGITLQDVKSLGL